jgi:hypothetical protein
MLHPIEPAFSFRVVVFLHLFDDSLEVQLHAQIPLMKRFSCFILSKNPTASECERLSSVMAIASIAITYHLPSSHLNKRITLRIFALKI